MVEAIFRNRIREARFNHAEQILRRVRQKIFDYEDIGLYDKAKKVMATCQRIIAPRYKAIKEAREFAKQNQYMRMME